MPNPALGTAAVPALLFGSGIVLMLCGALGTFVWRRQGLTFGEIFLAGSSAAAHPERYVRSDRLKAIRWLNMAGVSLFVLGVLSSLAQGMLRHWQ